MVLKDEDERCNDGITLTVPQINKLLQTAACVHSSTYLLFKSLLLHRYACRRIDSARLTAAGAVDAW